MSPWANTSGRSLLNSTPLLQTVKEGNRCAYCLCTDINELRILIRIKDCIKLLRDCEYELII